ncbi:hypothetical protein NEMBOFW57_001362 [Staphylotrichum longicolle]|uniref:Uncharacterized protein n=1 Tax=Staphylotrichum longicolle TaxID=669026 RepID=A0AAD4I0R6_9PEZI|nr:hypothetical protein NEMBOFW57_001362 [Staphylotrichum longicolle]
MTSASMTYLSPEAQIFARELAAIQDVKAAKNPEPGSMPHSALPIVALARASMGTARQFLPAGVIHLAFRTCKGALTTPREHPNIAFDGVDALVCGRPRNDLEVIEKIATSPERQRKICSLFQRRAKTPTLAVTKQYLHSFAAISTFPFLNDGDNRGRNHGHDDDVALEKAAVASLRRSDIGAYMTSLHYTADLITFALGRKLTLSSHDEPRLYSEGQLRNPVIRMSDHLLDNPFTAMVVLNLHLSRPRGVYIDESGRPWAAAAVDGGDFELRRRWAENCIHVFTAMDVFLSFTRCVSHAEMAISRVEGTAGSVSAT